MEVSNSLLNTHLYIHTYMCMIMGHCFIRSKYIVITAHSVVHCTLYSYIYMCSVCIHVLYVLLRLSSFLLHIFLPLSLCREQQQPVVSDLCQY